MTVLIDRPLPTAPAVRSRYPGTYWALVLGMGLSRIGAVLVPFLTLYLVGLGLSASTAGQISATWGAGWLLGQPIAGVLADRIGRKPTIVLTLLLSAGAYVGLCSTTSVPLLMVLAGVIGLVFDAPRAVVAVWIADLVPPDRVSAGYGMSYWLLNVGGAGGGVLGGYLSAGHLILLCLTDAAVTLAFAALVLALPAGKAGKAEAARPRVPLRGVLLDLRLITITVLSLLTMVAYLQYSYGLPLAVRAAGLPTGVYGTLTAANCLAVLALQPVMQPLINRARPLLMCAAGAAAIGLGMAGNAFAHSTAEFIVCTVVWSLGEVLFYSSAQTYVVVLAPEAARGRYLGLWGVSFGASALLAPLIGAVTLAHSERLLWMTTGGMAAVGSLGLLALAATRAGQRRPPAEPQPEERAPKESDVPA